MMFCLKNLRKLFLLSALLLCSISISAKADNYPRNPDIDILHYTFRLTLNDNNNIIKGRTSVDILFKSAGVSEFSLDLKGKNPGKESGMTVEFISVNGKPVIFSHENDRIRLKMLSPSRKSERRIYTITYSGMPEDGLIISKNKFGDRTFFADNWPDRCRNWLPVIDHPYEKATCEFIITAPGHYQVVSNGYKAEETNLKDNDRLTHWKEAVPISTYCMVFGAARFAVQNMYGPGGIPVQTWVFPQNREKGFFDFARTGRVIEFFNGKIGDFPYEKLANVQSKTRYGGMENASAVFYYENSVTGTRRIENTVVHELAHMWFGDSVTEADWHHIWLSEGFATYFTHVFNEFTFGRDRMVEGLKNNRRRIINYYKEHPESPVIDLKIKNLMHLLNANSYQKGSFILHMLRAELGDEVFFNGIRSYYGKYINGIAVTEDFQKVMENTGGVNLDNFFKQWVYTPGHPVLKGKWNYNKKTKKLKIRIIQVQKSGNVFIFPLEIGIYFPDKTIPEITKLNIRTKNEEFLIPADLAPRKVMLDPNTVLLFEDSGFGKK